MTSRGDKESKNDGNDDNKVEFAEPIQSHPWVETEQKGGGGEEKRESRFDSKFYMLCTALAVVSSGVLYTFFTPYAKSIGIPILLVGVITFVFGLGRFPMYVIIVNERLRFYFLRNDKRRRILIAALVVIAVASFSITVRDTSGVIYIIAYDAVGAAYSVVYAISQVGLIAETEPGKSGRGAGLFESSIGIGASIGPIVAGSISGSSVSIPFIVPSFGLAVFAVALPFIGTPKRE